MTMLSRIKSALPRQTYTPWSTLLSASLTRAQGPNDDLMTEIWPRFSSTASELAANSPSPPPMSFVPRHSSPSPDSLKKLIDVVSSSRRLVILTGAGISTESGIPDYRSEQVGKFA